MASIHASIDHVRLPSDRWLWLCGVGRGVVQADVASRDRVLDWVSRVIRLNAQRKKMRYNPNEVATEGFWINLAVVLVRLCVKMVVAPTTFGANKQIALNLGLELKDAGEDSDAPLNAPASASATASASASTSESTRIDPFYLFSDGKDGARMDYSSETRVRATPLELLSLRVALQPTAKLVTAGTVGLLPITAASAAPSAAAPLALTTAPPPAAAEATDAKDVKSALPSSAGAAAATPASASASASAAAAPAAGGAKPKPAATQLPVYSFPKRSFNLATELFFLTHEILSVGLHKSMLLYRRSMDDIMYGAVTPLPSLTFLLSLDVPVWMCGCVCVVCAAV
jgi:hypothetical protein